MPELHLNLPCLTGMGPAYKVLFRPASGAYTQRVLRAGSAREAELNPGFEQHEGVACVKASKRRCWSFC